MKYTSYKNANILCLPGEKAVKATYTDINGQKHDCYVIVREGKRKTCKYYDVTMESNCSKGESTESAENCPSRKEQCQDDNENK